MKYFIITICVIFTGCTVKKVTDDSFLSEMHRRFGLNLEHNEITNLRHDSYLGVDGDYTAYVRFDIDDLKKTQIVLNVDNHNNDAYVYSEDYPWGTSPPSDFAPKWWNAHKGKAEGVFYVNNQNGTITMAWYKIGDHEYTCYITYYGILSEGSTQLGSTQLGDGGK